MCIETISAVVFTLLDRLSFVCSNIRKVLNMWSFCYRHNCVALGSRVIGSRYICLSTSTDVTGVHVHIFVKVRTRDQGLDRAETTQPRRALAPRPRPDRLPVRPARHGDVKIRRPPPAAHHRRQRQLQPVPAALLPLPPQRAQVCTGVVYNSILAFMIDIYNVSIGRDCICCSRPLWRPYICKICRDCGKMFSLETPYSKLLLLAV